MCCIFEQVDLSELDTFPKSLGANMVHKTDLQGYWSERRNDGICSGVRNNYNAFRHFRIPKCIIVTICSQLTCSLQRYLR